MGLPRYLGFLAFACCLLAACASATSSAVKVEGAWARPGGASQGAMGAGAMSAMTPTANPEMTMGMSAAYFTVLGGSAADALVGASVDPSVAETAEVHETTVEGGVAKMQHVPRVEIPAGGRVEFKPGGYHVMLMNLKRELKAGDRVPLKLAFEKAGTVSVEAEVRAP